MTPEMVPCMGCADRHTACHDHCAKYSEWKVEHQKRQAMIKEYNRRRREDWLRGDLKTAREHKGIDKTGKAGIIRGKQ